jgi:hypothetical protein
VIVHEIETTTAEETARQTDVMTTITEADEETIEKGIAEDRESAMMIAFAHLTAGATAVERMIGT